MKKLLGAVMIVALLGIAPSAQATVLTFYLCYEFSGATPPEGAGPWLKATFDDFGGTGTVRLTMEAIGLTDQEFVSEWSFNLDPALDPTTLSFAGVNTAAVGATTISTGVDAFQADGDGSFDIMFDFPPPPGTFASKFTAGELVSYDITLAGITANSFDFGSAPGGGAGTYKTAAHVQGIGPDDSQSGWVGDCLPTPEPTSMLLLGMGLAGVAGAGFRRRKN
jgi:hypothetical protein